MKKYISSALISCMLIQLYGCYSMQEITKEEFKQQIEKSDLRIGTQKFKYTFKEADYLVVNDSIVGRGKSELNQGRTFNEQLIVDFDGKIALSDVETFEMEELDIVITVIVLGISMMLTYHLAEYLNFSPYKHSLF